MNYSKDLNKNSHINIVVGVTYQKFTVQGFTAVISNFPSDDLKTNNLGLGDTGSVHLPATKGTIL